MTSCKSLYLSNWKILKKYIIFLDRYHLSKLNQDHINHLDRPITPKKQKLSLKLTQPKKKRERDRQTDDFSTEFSDFQRRVDVNTPQIIPQKTEETLPNSFYEVTVILISKPYKDSTKKENYSPISFMNIDSKILKYLQTESKNTSKRSSTMIKQASSQRCRDDSMYENLSM